MNMRGWAVLANGPSVRTAAPLLLLGRRTGRTPSWGRADRGACVWHVAVCLGPTPALGWPRVLHPGFGSRPPESPPWIQPQNPATALKGRRLSCCVPVLSHQAAGLCPHGPPPRTHPTPPLRGPRPEERPTRLGSCRGPAASEVCRLRSFPAALGLRASRNLLSRPFPHKPCCLPHAEPRVPRCSAASLCLPISAIRMLSMFSMC